MSIFPAIEEGLQAEEAREITDNAALREYAWDFMSNDFIFEDGRQKVTEGLEALKIWAYKALVTERYKYLAYSWDYGQEIANLIGSNISSEFVKSEVKRYIEEAFSVNPHIKGIKILSTTIEEDKISVDFTILSDLGEVGINV
ncbi:DUF2634 domain-containing protein [Ruminiclostridium cellobioparum]|uniref:DUF2634 domain-containing protein n=1 Tax=Ruminiclostridium cellobioparum TaxID=29355 RepID=UPI0004803221|nr:DUF2634 domain-containing protein [Ruminiclostridium cellobioparum]